MRHVSLSILATALFLLLQDTAAAYNRDHGPFPDNASIKPITMAKLAPSPREEDTIGKVDGSRLFTVPEHNNITLRMAECDPGWSAEISVDGKVVREKTKVTGYYIALQVFTANLNQDKIPDFVVYTFSNGCGLAAGNSHVAFLLSSENTYHATTIVSLFTDKDDFLLLNGKPCFIQADLLGVEECNDGKRHNFWVYNLVCIEKDQMKIQNNTAQGFPRIILYTKKPNHSETTVLSDDQKNELIESSKKGIFLESP